MHYFFFPVTKNRVKIKPMIKCGGCKTFQGLRKLLEKLKSTYLPLNTTPYLLRRRDIPHGILKLLRALTWTTYLPEEPAWPSVAAPVYFLTTFTTVENSLRPVRRCWVQLHYSSDTIGSEHQTRRSSAEPSGGTV
ncbi:unnamed protein product [Parnassius apollo]|uniref:(apollo) hypothetical protein n=1 Tax=Parnassius apollo TaxID=110799 RepID=A0A8S3X9Z0_PARAO|nr:unnamed protein product [Parnassius apollo]